MENLFKQGDSDKGYFVLFVGLNDPSINAGRIAGRAMKSGQDVPITKNIFTLW